MTEDSSWGLGWWCWEAATLGFPASKPHTTDPADWAIGPNVASPEGLRLQGLFDPSLEERQVHHPEAVGPSLVALAPEWHRLAPEANWSLVVAEGQPLVDHRLRSTSAVACVANFEHVYAS